MTKQDIIDPDLCVTERVIVYPLSLYQMNIIVESYDYTLWVD